MIKRMQILVCALAGSFSISAQVTILPQDLLSGQELLSDTTSIEQVSDNRFEITRKIPADPSVGMPFNFQTFCMASYLARERGYSGWSLGSRPAAEKKPEEMHYTVALLNSADGIAALPTDLKWTVYAAYKKTRDACVSFLNPKYLWPKE